MRIKDRGISCFRLPIHSYLAACDYVRAPLNGEPRYGLARKGRRYLRERGLHK